MAGNQTLTIWGLVSVLKQLHDDLDTAVAAAAYGWPADLDEQDILQRLVDLNHQRAAEEAEGHIRYLRPDYQNPDGPQATQEEFETTKGTKGTKKKSDLRPLTSDLRRQPWPKTLPEQLRALRSILEANPQPLTSAQLAKHFTRAPKKKISELMEVLEDLG